MINAYIQGSYVRLDGRLAGIQGESMSRTLRLNFSPEWGELTKRILWLDARGKQVVSQPLVASADEVLENNGLVIPVKIPGETLQYDGKTVFIVEGADENGAISLSAMAEMTVNPNDFYGKQAINAANPTPTEMQQLQATVEEAIGVAAADKQAAQAAAASSAEAAAKSEAAAGTAIENANMAGTYASQAAGAQRSAEKAAMDASGAADRAEAARQLAESYTNNPPVPGDNGNWQVWDGEKYVDSGVQAEAADGFSPLVSAKETSTGVDINITSYDEEKGTTVTQMVALKNGKDGSAGGLFVATYGITTYAEIKEAYDAGLVCICVSGALIGVLSVINASLARFSSTIIANNRVFDVKSDNTWSTINTKLVKCEGDTMTGPLLLSGEPTEALHAATKQYVDEKTGVANEVFIATYGETQFADILTAYEAGRVCFCKSANGKMIHALLTITPSSANFAGCYAYGARVYFVREINGVTYWEDTQYPAVMRSGGTMTGALTLAADPTEDLHAATKQYVDNAISAALAAHGIT